MTGKQPQTRAVTPADRDALFVKWHGWFRALGRRWYDFCCPFDRRGFGPDDLAQEFVRVAVQRFPLWNPERVTFPTWVKWVARGHAGYLRLKAKRLKRARRTVGQFAGGDFDRFAAMADPKAREPWELAAEREGDES